ncbi:energy transducer TonB [Pontixanthobacter aquaemixtae]|uniref:TonB family protein n=1 Tax=Pontixanthobacter aquaemixtae TaxID=1958940 RepID=A0A844ZPF2_9SPHN|nr:energy transducer TonB [Pontixanthobacter aquaemixtae]MXO89618.1 TonB family protein [Pontixanthobacter aquaemixtae]
MAYVNVGGPEDRKTAIAGVALIHAGLASVLVFGFAGGAITEFTRDILIGHDFTDPPDIPPPPPKPDVKDPVDPPSRTRPDIYLDDPVIELTDTPSPFDTTDEIPPAGGEIITNLGEGPGPGTGAGNNTDSLPGPITPPAFDPIPAKPINNPGSWVSNRDYRSSWIRRELTGIARFRVSIGTNGRVQDCRVLSSTGHSELDNATCSLVSRRAKFEAARDSQGNKVTGSFTTAISWELPD